MKTPQPEHVRILWKSKALSMTVKGKRILSAVASLINFSNPGKLKMLQALGKHDTQTDVKSHDMRLSNLLVCPSDRSQAKTHWFWAKNLRHGLQAQLRLILCAFYRFGFTMPLFLKLKTHFWIVQECSQLSRADHFNDDMQLWLSGKKKNKPKVFMPLIVEVSLKVRYMYI